MDSSHSRAILTGVVFALRRESHNNEQTLMTTSHSTVTCLKSQSKYSASQIESRWNFPWRTPRTVAFSQLSVWSPLVDPYAKLFTCYVLLRNERRLRIKRCHLGLERLRKGIYFPCISPLQHFYEYYFMDCMQNMWWAQVTLLNWSLPWLDQY